MGVTLPPSLDDVLQSTASSLRLVSSARGHRGSLVDTPRHGPGPTMPS